MEYSANPGWPLHIDLPPSTTQKPQSSFLCLTEHDFFFFGILFLCLQSVWIKAIKSCLIFTVTELYASILYIKKTQGGSTREHSL